MKHAQHSMIITLASLSFLSAAVFADGTFSDEPPTIGGQWFMTYQSGKNHGRRESRFIINRGYINIKKRLTGRISGRITPDISVDREGDGEGDLEMRLKYCYLAVDIADLAFLNEPFVEFGLAHRPWLDFEQNINRYRVRGKMYLDRYKVTNSADFGVTFFALLGEKTDIPGVKGKYAGRYGSLAVGVYNGGGYHAIEQNNNKTVEARLSVRPLPDILPGLQVSYHGVRGKGNASFSPDWSLDMGCLTMEQRRFAATATLYAGTGNYLGDLLDGAGGAADLGGYSLFGELRFAERKYALFGRFDSFDDSESTGSDDLRRIIAGAAYRIQGETKIVAGYEISTRDDWAGAPEKMAQLSVEYNF